MCAGARAYMWRLEANIRVLLQLLSTLLILLYLWGTLNEPGAGWLTTLSGQCIWDLLVSISPVLELQMSSCILCFYVDTRHLNSGPHICVTSTLHSKPSPNSKMFLFLSWFFFMLNINAYCFNGVKVMNPVHLASVFFCRPIVDCFCHL